MDKNFAIKTSSSKVESFLLEIESNKFLKATHLSAALIPSPLGGLLAIASPFSLYYLDLAECLDLKIILKISRQLEKNIKLEDNNPILKTLQKELDSYFNGTLLYFKTPLELLGTPFQQSSWQRLQEIPYGATQSYAQQAQGSKAYRAIGSANGKNPILILVPCHRVVRGNGALGGFRSGLSCKTWLLAHEKNTLEKKEKNHAT